MKIYGSIEKIEKQADGTIYVHGYASSEAVDADGEIIKASAIKGAIPDYMKFANIREMHQPKAAGTTIEMEVQDDGRTFIKAHIVDADAVLKVNNKVYKGFSIGGRVTERDAEDKKIIKGIRLSEISLVDRPANPEAVFTICKVELDKEGDGAGAGVDVSKPADESKKDEKLNTSADGVQKPDAPADGEKKADDSTKSAETADNKLDGKTEVVKGMYAVSNLASLLATISYLQSDAAWERDNEGDASTVPEALKAWLKTGGEILKAMVTEEVAELIGEEQGVVVEVISLADRVKNLVKAAWTPEESEKFSKGFDLLVSRGTVLAKAGARNSKADQKHIDAIHTAAIALGAECGTDKAAGGSDDLKKVQDDFTKLQSENTELKTVVDLFTKRINELEALPAAPKAALKVMEKGKDDATTIAEKAEDEPKNGVDAMKKIWKGGGKPA